MKMTNEEYSKCEKAFNEFCNAIDDCNGCSYKEDNNSIIGFSYCHMRYAIEWKEKEDKDNEKETCLNCEHCRPPSEYTMFRCRVGDVLYNYGRRGCDKYKRKGMKDEKYNTLLCKLNRLEAYLVKIDNIMQKLEVMQTLPKLGMNNE